MTLRQRMHSLTGPMAQLALVLALLLAIVTVMLQSTVAIGSQQGADADRHLGAIKQALIDLSLGTELRLTTTAFVDERGALHESSLITSQSQVRGVRVLSYLQEAGLEIASLDATMVADDCPAARPGLRRQARMSILPGRQDPRLGDHYVSELAALSQQLLSKAIARTATWSAAPAQQFASSYHQKMSATGGNRPPFELQISLAQAEQEFTEKSGSPSTRRSSPMLWKVPMIPRFVNLELWPNQFLDVELRLVDPKLGTVVLLEKSQLEYPRLERGYDKSQLPTQFVDQLDAIAQRFVGQMDGALECRRHYYHVTNSHVINSHVTNSHRSSSQVAGSPSDASTSSLRINAGSLAGVQVGDQFLLSPTPQITGQGADLADIERLMLAQVQAVDAHGATLQVTAGQVPAGKVPSVAKVRSGSSISHNFNHYVAIYF